MGNSSSKRTQTSSTQPPSKDRRGEVKPGASSVRPPRQDKSGARPRVSEPAVPNVDKKTLSPEQQAIGTTLKEVNYEEQINETRKAMAKNLKEFNESTKGLLDFRDQLMGIENLPSELQASLNPLEAACRVAEDINEELKIFSNIVNDLFDKHQRVKFGSLEKEELNLEESEMRTLQKKLLLYQKKLNLGLQSCKEHVKNFENCFERAIGSLDRIKEELQSDRKMSIAKGCLVAAGLLLGGAVVVGAAIFLMKQGGMELIKNLPAAVASVPMRCGKFLISSMSNAIGDFRDAQAQLKRIREYQELLDEPNSLNFETENVSEMIKMVLTEANTCCEEVLKSIEKEEQLIQLMQEKEQWKQDKEQNIQIKHENEKLKAVVALLEKEKEQTIQTQQQQEQTVQQQDQTVQTQQEEEQTIQTQQQEEEQTVQTQQQEEEKTVQTQQQEEEQTVQTQQQEEEQTVQTQQQEEEQTVQTQQQEEEQTVQTQQQEEEQTVQTQQQEEEADQNVQSCAIFGACPRPYRLNPHRTSP